MAAPNPLRLATQLDADRQQERQETSWRDAARAQRSQKAFLERDTRSYTRPEKTEEESFMETQRKMSETAEGLSPEGVTANRAEEPEAPPESGIRQRRPQPSAEEQRAARAEEEQIQIAQRFQRLQQLEQQTQRAEVQETEKLKQGVQLIQQTKKEWQNIRQFSEAASGVGVVLLIAELNAQTLATLFGIKIPGLQKASRPRMVLTACLDCGACVNLTIMFLPVILGIVIVWWMISNPGEAIWFYFRSLFGV